MKGRKTFSLSSNERIKSRKKADEVFTAGKSVSAFPLRAFYLSNNKDAESIVQAGFGVSSKNFKKAVDRNRIKRLIREAYRLNKKELTGLSEKNKTSFHIFFIFTGRDFPDFTLTEQKMKSVLKKLCNEFSA